MEVTTHTALLSHILAHLIDASVRSGRFSYYSLMHYVDVYHHYHVISLVKNSEVEKPEMMDKQLMQ